ncbi:hypothetical protein IEQ11_15985 [Lysobacter capsici]|uniref:Uncharacterized protein n=1 Tax=Lysobacter firmicutimachus TaxID=1792846 RepID=A0ABU8D2B4_9GAMM|nr:hypothetical protein [Lysobacter capsici]UOF13244.1 hypothetical protein IEQ11_15985 [Lysobacter capsici]
MSRTPDIDAGQVWVARKRRTRTPSRRVVAAINGRICYSAGGDVTRWCRLRAFLVWLRRYNAVRTDPRRRRALSACWRGA